MTLRTASITQIQLSHLALLKKKIMKAGVDAEGMTFSVVESQTLGSESEPTGSNAENPVTRQGRVSRKPARFLN